MEKERINWRNVFILLASAVGIISALLCAIFCGNSDAISIVSNGADLIILTSFTFLFALIFVKRFMEMSGRAFIVVQILIIGLTVFLAAAQIIRNYNYEDLQYKMSVVHQTMLWTRLFACIPVIFLLKERRLKSEIIKETVNNQKGISIPAHFTTEKEVPLKISMSQKKNSVIQKLTDLRESNLITEDEFIQLRSKLILSDFLLTIFN